MQAPEQATARQADKQQGYNTEVSQVLKKRNIEIKDELTGDWLGTAYVWLAEMSEADVAARTRMVLEQKKAKKRGNDEEVQINAERIRQYDFVKSIEDWEGFMRPKRDENGNIEYSVEPEYALDDNGQIRRSRKTGKPLMVKAGEPVLEDMPFGPQGFKQLGQYIGDQINTEIREINQLPDTPEDLDVATGRRKGSDKAKALAGMTQDEKDEEAVRGLGEEGEGENGAGGEDPKD